MVSPFRNDLLCGRRALVTGAASGMGNAIAHRLARHGATVIAADISPEVERIGRSIGGESWVIDLSRTTELESTALDVDILVNCAGLQHVESFETFDPEQFRILHRVMLEAPFLLIRAALPAMYRRGWGRIVNITSVNGLVAAPFKAAYVSAKHGLEGLSQVAALEGAAHGVTSNCIEPGVVMTPLLAGQIKALAREYRIPVADVVEQRMLADAAIKRPISPDEIADLVLWLCTDSAAMVTGASNPMDGGFTVR